MSVSLFWQKAYIRKYTIVMKLLRIAAGWYATSAWVGVTPTKAKSPRGCLRIPMNDCPPSPPNYA